MFFQSPIPLHFFLGLGQAGNQHLRCSHSCHDNCRDVGTVTMTSAETYPQFPWQLLRCRHSCRDNSWDIGTVTITTAEM
jgi:hypothetical protein